MNRINICFLLIPMLFLFLTPYTAAEDAPATHIAVVPMENNTGDRQYDAVCETVTDTVALILRFLKGYNVFTEDENPDLRRLPDTGPETLRQIGEDQRYDQIIIGSTELRDQGGFVLSLSIFNTFEGTYQVQETAVAESVFDIFDAADSITLALISQVSDIHIGFGAIQLERGSGFGRIEVYLDGKQIKNWERVFRKVLNGTYTLEVLQQRLLGDTVILRREIEVVENQTTTVAFDIPGASDEEFAFLEERGRELIAEGEDPGNIEAFLAAIADFQRETGYTGYDGELEERKSEILERVSQTAVAALEKLKEEGDSLYYRKNPDFEAALEKYERVSDLLNNVFNVTVTYPTDVEMEKPFRIITAADKVSYTLDGSGSVTLTSFDPEANKIAETRVPGRADGFLGDLCTDTVGKLYFFTPRREEITVFDQRLEELETIPVPGFEKKNEKAGIDFSPAGVLYIITGTDVYVFDPAGVLSEDGEKVIIDRQTAVEEAVSSRLEQEPDFICTTLFFDDSTRLLNIYNSNTGKLLRFDELGNLHSELTFETHEEETRVSIDSLGYYYLVTTKYHRIEKYSPNGELITRIGGYGSKPSQFARPRDAAVDQEGTIYVADTYNHRIQILELTSPPILLPSVAQYGIAFKRRIERTQSAIEKLENAREQIKILPLVTKFGASAVLLGSSYGLKYAADVQEQEYVTTWGPYTEEDGGNFLELFRSESGLEWILYRTTEMSSLAAFGIGTMLLTSDLLLLGEYLTLRSYTISNLQSVSMDRDYVLDEDKYKGLRTAQTIGTWTGIMPPLLGGAVALGLGLFVPDIDPITLSLIVGGSVIAPPIFSHLYGGRFNVGLLSAGLVADILALSALLVISNAPGGQHPAFDYADATERDVSADSSWNEMWDEKLPVYLMVAAVGVRLAAGIWDTNHGWIRAHHHNRYRAGEEEEEEEFDTSEVAFTVFPFIDPQQRIGLAGRLSF